MVTAVEGILPVASLVGTNYDEPVDYYESSNDAGSKEAVTDTEANKHSNLKEKWDSGKTTMNSSHKTETANLPANPRVTVEALLLILGQIYYAFQEGVLLIVFSNCEDSFIPFWHLGAMEKAMFAEKNDNLFGGEEQRNTAIKNWESLKKNIQFQKNDLSSLECIRRFASGYDKPRIESSEFWKALHGVKAAKQSYMNEDEIKAFERVVELYATLEKCCTPDCDLEPMQ